MESMVFEKIKELVAQQDVLISAHGYDELAEDGILVKEVLSSVNTAIVIEDYPEFKKGPCCLVLQKDKNDASIHVVWGISAGTERPAVLITAYRPSDERWDDDYTRRRNAK